MKPMSKPTKMIKTILKPKPKTEMVGVVVGRTCPENHKPKTKNSLTFCQYVI